MKQINKEKRIRRRRLRLRKQYRKWTHGQNAPIKVIKKRLHK